MRLFGSDDRMTKIMERFGLEEGQELEHPWLNHSIETAQKRVEQHNFQIRKRTLEYDDVMNKQREVVYGFRNEVIDSDDPRKLIYEVIDEAIPAKVQEYLGSDDGDEPNYAGAAELGEHHLPARPDRGERAVRNTERRGERAIPDREDQEGLRAEVEPRRADGGARVSSATSC